MIPVVLGYGFALGFGTAWAVSSGASAGFSYAMGRKYGRAICEKVDQFETKLKEVLTNE